MYVCVKTAIKITKKYTLTINQSWFCHTKNVGHPKTPLTFFATPTSFLNDNDIF